MLKQLKCTKRFKFFFQFCNVYLVQDKFPKWNLLHSSTLLRTISNCQISLLLYKSYNWLPWKWTEINMGLLQRFHQLCKSLQLLFFMKINKNVQTYNENLNINNAPKFFAQSLKKLKLKLPKQQCLVSLLTSFFSTNLRRRKLCLLLPCFFQNCKLGMNKTTKFSFLKKAQPQLVLNVNWIISLIN